MKLNDERKKRYRSKIGYIVEKMHTLPEDTTTLDELGIDGVLYRVQTSIEAAVDIVAMMVRDIGIEVGDDYENIEMLSKKKVIDTGLSDELKKLNGMRNIIVHRYGQVDVDLVLKNLGTVGELLQRFINIVEGEIL